MDGQTSINESSVELVTLADGTRSPRPASRVASTLSPKGGVTHTRSLSLSPPVSPLPLHPSLFPQQMASLRCCFKPPYPIALLGNQCCQDDVRKQQGSDSRAGCRGTFQTETASLLAVLTCV
jgi:hypothetical protein